ncbi:hypothetical protein GLA29479_3731 [Lysobacter antibioticus]|uniref:hypothetical protein n=1 Tax=Lysobacter antibioticus TaxID=84531 RepID=UPI0007172787|nr:hypothetical protein [Lysobacter antibioticus]ALN64582.1 hypothetical protein GLA29479_3731 [Lysobacter antibioticus]
MIPTFFKGSTDVKDMLQDLVDDGLIGIQGGRVEVRKRLSELDALLRREGLRGYNTATSINHPDTEIGVAFYMDLFTFNEARASLLRGYELLNRQPVR